MDNVITINDLTKIYKIYDKPLDRLRESISLRSKSIWHKQYYALNNITLNIKKGEILGIIGENGAGKSTLLKIISGVLRESCGNVNVYGKISSLLELGIGFNHEYTGIDNIILYCKLHGLQREEIDSKIDEIIDFAEIGDYVYQPIKTYSSGMFARLAFACAINVNSEILIVDEILSVGDIQFQSKCFNKFKEFKNQDVTIIYVGHDIGTIRSFCDRVVWLKNGQLEMVGEPKHVTSEYAEYMYTTNKSVASKKIYDEDEVGNISDRQVFNKALNHWGSKKGIINSVKMVNDQNKEKDIFSPFEKIKIICELDYDSQIDYQNLSCAFSIKDKKGLDLIVYTTYDEELNIYKSDKVITVEFELSTYLNSGEYYLVVALENRKNVSISYYEYIEGVKYFKIYSDKRIYGQFIPPCAIKIK